MSQKRPDHRSLNNFLQSVLAVLLLAWTPLQAIELSQSLKPSAIPFEERAEFEIVITWPGPQSKYLFPKPLRPQFERLSAGRLSSSISSTGTGSDEVTTKTYRYELSPTLSGLGRIEPITIEYVSWPDSIPGQLVTEPMTIQIDAPRPAPPKDESSGAGLWIIIIAVILAGGGAVYYFLVVKKKSDQPILLSPEDAFLESLSTVQDEAGNDLKRFQTGLYKSLCDYLTVKFNMPSDLETARSIGEWLKGCGLSPDVRAMLAGWLIRAEKEKFTPTGADPGATTRLYSEVKHIFETKLK